jgi:DNA-binding transcriptional MerR regulator
MAQLTVHHLAKQAGVTGRTLRFYDRIGLLSPASTGDNGYRRYGDAERLRLQQILFFRELDFSLAEIKAMLDHPDFDAAKSLRDQRRMLELQRDRLGRLIGTIDETLTSMSTQQPLDERDLYGGLSTETIESYKKEAKERWGRTDAYKQSQQRVGKFTKADWDAIKDESHAVCADLTALLVAGVPADAPETRPIMARHFGVMNRFYDCSLQIYRGLGDMYVADERFGANYTPYHPQLPQYLRDAMHAFADHREREGAKK